MTVQYRDRIDRALADLEQRGVNRSQAAPPLFRWAWDHGMEVPPPHFMSFLDLVLYTGGYFGAFFTPLLWASLTFAFGILMGRWWAGPLYIWIAAGILAGSLFGLSMACYFRLDAQRLKLPAWEEYGRIART